MLQPPPAVLPLAALTRHHGVPGLLPPWPLTTAKQMVYQLGLRAYRNWVTEQGLKIGPQSLRKGREIYAKYFRETCGVLKEVDGVHRKGK